MMNLEREYASFEKFCLTLLAIVVFIIAVVFIWSGILFPKDKKYCEQFKQLKVSDVPAQCVKYYK